MTALADVSVAQAGPRACRGPGNRGPGPAVVRGAIPAADRPRLMPGRLLTGSGVSSVRFCLVSRGSMALRAAKPCSPSKATSTSGSPGMFSWMAWHSGAKKMKTPSGLSAGSQEVSQVLLGLADCDRDGVHVSLRQVAGAEAGCRDHAGELSLLVAGHPGAHHAVA